MNGPIDAENVEYHASPEGIVVDMTVLGYLRSSGYPVEDVKELHTVKREDSDTAHVVAKIETLNKPRDDPELDIVEDKCTIWVCDCWRYRRQEWPDVREYGNSPTDHGTCPHIESVSKTQRAANDENQEKLL